MAADDALFALHDAGNREPRIQAGHLRARRALGLERDASARRAIAQSREHVDDRAFAIQAFELGRPGRAVAVHIAQQLAVVLAVQHRLDFARARLGQRDGPFRHQAGVQHRPANAAIHMHQVLRAQPVQQFIAIRREQHRLQICVDLALLIGLALGDREQREIVIAQDDRTVDRQRMHEAQGCERLAATIDQIAAEPQAVLRGIEADFFQQSLQWIVATLQVANGPGRQCRVLGTDSVNAGIGASKRVPSSASMS